MSPICNLKFFLSQYEIFIKITNKLRINLINKFFLIWIIINKSIKYFFTLDNDSN